MRSIVVVPTYNNAKTLQTVLDRLWVYTQDIMVVNDGSTDETLTILHHYPHPINIVTYSENRGKGHALVRGFREAMMLGYDYAITITATGSTIPRTCPCSCARQVNSIAPQSSLEVANSSMRTSHVELFSPLGLPTSGLRFRRGSIFLTHRAAIVSILCIICMGST